MTSYPRRLWPALLATLALAALPAQGNAAGADDAPRLAAAEVKRLAAKGEVVIVDVRTRDAYDLEHAEGAVSIPLQEIEARMSELPKNKLIATYCT